MALLTGWQGKSGYTGPNNRIQEEGPKSIPMPMGILVVGGVAFRNDQTTDTERYSFVGMDYATARLCQAAMISAITVDGVVRGDVSVTRQAGNMWQTTVSYNYVRATLTEITP